MYQLPLTNSPQFAFVDDADYARLRWTQWRLTSEGYVIQSRSPAVLLHRFLLDAQPGQIVDHRDGNKLNNTRANLRLVTNAQNIWNRSVAVDSRSGLRGIAWRADKGYWYVRLQANGKRVHLGYYNDLDLAIQVRDEACRRLHGEYGQLIVPERLPSPAAVAAVERYLRQAGLA